jgi:hypothetical protein
VSWELVLTEILHTEPRLVMPSCSDSKTTCFGRTQLSRCTSTFAHEDTKRSCYVSKCKIVHVHAMKAYMEMGA